MKIDKGEISGTQFMLSISCFIQSSTMLTSFIASIAKQDAWISVLFGIVCCLPLIWVYRSIMIEFPGQNLLEILEVVFGRVIGKILGAAYICFFVTLASVNLMDLGDFTRLTIMEETPNIVLVVMCIIVSSIAVRSGIKLVTKYSALFTVISFFILFISVLLVANLIKPDHLLPIFDQPPMKYIQSTHIIATIPFGEVVAFLMITPNIKLSKKQLTSRLFWGFGMGAFMILVVMLRDITVLGNTLNLFTLPSLVTLRLVNFGASLSRVEVLFVVVLILLLFFKITFLYYISVISIAHFFKIKAYKYLALSVGAFMIAYGLTLYPSAAEHAASAHQIVPILWTPFEIIIPLLILITAKVRKLPKAQRA